MMCFSKFKSWRTKSFDGISVGYVNENVNIDSILKIRSEYFRKNEEDWNILNVEPTIRNQDVLNKNCYLKIICHCVLLCLNKNCKHHYNFFYILLNCYI